MPGGSFNKFKNLSGAAAGNEAMQLGYGTITMRKRGESLVVYHGQTRNRSMTDGGLSSGKRDSGNNIKTAFSSDSSLLPSVQDTGSSSAAITSHRASSNDPHIGASAATSEAAATSNNSTSLKRFRTETDAQHLASLQESVVALRSSFRNSGSKPSLPVSPEYNQFDENDAEDSDDEVQHNITNKAGNATNSKQDSIGNGKATNNNNNNNNPSGSPTHKAKYTIEVSLSKENANDGFRLNRQLSSSPRAGSGPNDGSGSAQATRASSKSNSFYFMKHTYLGKFYFLLPIGIILTLLDLLPPFILTLTTDVPEDANNVGCLYDT